MRVLFVTNNYLHISGGGAFATRAIVNAFAEISEKVKLLYPAQNGIIPPKINTSVEAIPIYYNALKIKKGIDIYCGKIHRYYDCFEQQLDSSIDTVVFDVSIVSHKLLDVAKKKGLKVITIHHNYQVEFAKDDTSFLFKYPVMHWVKMAEAEAVTKSDLNICLTKSDKEAFLQHYCKDAHIVVLGIFEVNKKAPLSISERHSNGHNYIITGNLSVKQTTDALYPWISVYYPLLLSIDPVAKLRIAGFHPRKELFELCKKNGIELIDTPESMEPYLLDSDYYICPTDLGSGIKLRIMDGLSAGIPVITQKKSIRGYEQFEGKSVFTFENEQTFTQLIKELLVKQFDHKVIQECYLKDFSFEKGVRRLQEIISFMK